MRVNVAAAGGAQLVDVAGSPPLQVQPLGPRSDSQVSEAHPSVAGEVGAKEDQMASLWLETCLPLPSTVRPVSTDKQNPGLEIQTAMVRPSFFSLETVFEALFKLELSLLGQLQTDYLKPACKFWAKNGGT